MRVYPVPVAPWGDGELIPHEQFRAVFPSHRTVFYDVGMLSDESDETAESLHRKLMMGHACHQYAGDEFCFCDDGPGEAVSIVPLVLFQTATRPSDPRLSIPPPPPPAKTDWNVEIGPSYPRWLIALWVALILALCVYLIGTCATGGCGR